jgi:hypothetical protein
VQFSTSAFVATTIPGRGKSKMPTSHFICFINETGLVVLFRLVVMVCTCTLDEALINNHE